MNEDFVSCFSLPYVRPFVRLSVYLRIDYYLGGLFPFLSDLSMMDVGLHSSLTACLPLTFPSSASWPGVLSHKVMISLESSDALQTLKRSLSLIMVRSFVVVVIIFCLTSSVRPSYSCVSRPKTPPRLPGIEHTIYSR